MRSSIIIFLLYLLGGVFFNLNAQEPVVKDSTIRTDSLSPVIAGLERDSIPIISEKDIIFPDSILINKSEFKPNSTRAVLYSAIFPGLGQIYNRKYWKLPIVYGGAIGLTYAITWNGRVYNDYNEAYLDLMIPGRGTSYNDFVSNPSVIENNKDLYIGKFKRQRDFYRRNRDLAIIVAVGVYALCMIDAYVDAQLYNFDMSPDLSIKIVPAVWGPSSLSTTSVGLQCYIVF